MVNTVNIKPTCKNFSVPFSLFCFEDVWRGLRSVFLWQICRSETWTIWLCFYTISSCFLFAVWYNLKVSDITYIFSKDNWRSNTINSFIYFYQKLLQVSLMNGIFFIFRDSVLKLLFWSSFIVFKALSCNFFNQIIRLPWTKHPG